MANVTTVGNERMGVAVTEGEAGDVLTFGSVEEARGYARGFTDGANEYGAGSARVLLYADWATLDEGERAIVRAKIGEPDARVAHNHFGEILVSACPGCIAELAAQGRRFPLEGG